MTCIRCGAPAAGAFCRPCRNKAKFTKALMSGPVEKPVQDDCDLVVCGEDDFVKPAVAGPMVRETCATCGRMIERTYYCHVGNNTVPFCDPQCAKVFGAGRAAGEAGGA